MAEVGPELQVRRPASASWWPSCPRSRSSCGCGWRRAWCQPSTGTTAHCQRASLVADSLLSWTAMMITSPGPPVPRLPAAVRVPPGT